MEPLLGAVRLRRLLAVDRDVLVLATLANVNWCGPRLERADIEGTPALRHYVDLVTGRGDWGHVAEVDGRPLGVTWALFLDHREPGYGFVADGIPELSISVASDARGQGVGRLLMAAVLAEAGARAPLGISLSVESGNPARAWYERLGFAPAGPGYDDGTLLRPARDQEQPARTE